jgi:hypothetical protein
LLAHDRTAAAAAAAASGASFGAIGHAQPKTNLSLCLPVFDGHSVWSVCIHV